MDRLRRGCTLTSPLSQKAHRDHGAHVAKDTLIHGTKLILPIAHTVYNSNRSLTVSITTSPCVHISKSVANLRLDHLPSQCNDDEASIHRDAPIYSVMLGYSLLSHHRFSPMTTVDSIRLDGVQTNHRRAFPLRTCHRLFSFRQP